MTAQNLLNALLHYKADADHELLDALTALDPKNAPQDFPVAIRILNHAHIVDRIFAAHLQGRDHPYKASWSGEVPPFAQLSSDIRETDLWYIDYLSRIGIHELEEVVAFTFTDGARGLMSREEMIAHVVTHGGYHRGEVGRLLPQIETTAMRDVFTGYLHRSQPERRQ